MYRIKLDPLAISDIQAIVDYYNSKRKGLGSIFKEDLKIVEQSLRLNPFFEIRTSGVLPSVSFPTWHII